MSNETMCIIILILCCVACLLYLLYRVKRDGLRNVATELIVYAEKKLGSKTGKEKMKLVVDALTRQIPPPFNMLITESTIEAFAQGVFNQVKNALDYTPIDRDAQ